MKDRNVQFPNRYKLTPVSGDVYDLTPEPGIVTEPGTDLNKAFLQQFLAASGTTSGTSDALALVQDGFTLFDGATVRFKLHTDLGASATLNVSGTGAKALTSSTGIAAPDGMKAGAWVTASYSSTLDKYVITDCGTEAVGTIKTSARTDLGDSWLLCNGAAIDAEAYPELDSLFPHVEAPWNYRFIRDNSYRTFFDCGYAAGYYVFLVRTNSASRLLAYTTSLTGDLTYVNVGDDGRAISYVNDRWFVGCRYGRLYYSNPSAPISWGYVTIDSTQDQNVPGNVAFDGSGYFATCNESYGSSYTKNIWCSNGTNMAAAWSSKALPVTDFYAKQVYYLNNLCVVLCGRNSGATPTGVYIAYSPTYNGTYNYTTVSSSTALKPLGIAYINGVWYVVVGDVASPYNVQVFYSDSIDGPWGTYAVPVSTGVADTAYMYYINGYYIIKTSQHENAGRIVFTKDFTEWFGATGVNMPGNFGYDGSTFFIGKYLNSPMTEGIYSTQALESAYLPTQTADNSYVYIKAK